MKQTAITKRLAGLGGAKWEVYLKAKDLVAQGRDVIEMTIGEPDVPTPAELVDTAAQAMRQGRTTYSNGPGEAGLRAALAERYTRSSGREIADDQVLCFPGTQTALFTVLMGVAEQGCEVLVGDPMYATYEGVVRASGADMIPFPLRPENGFRIAAEDIAARITPRTSAILLTTPHNPTGAVLRADDMRAIGEFAKAHDLWIVSDEVYEDLTFGDGFVSPLDFPDLAERTVVVSSISKSHAAPGFRSGWIVAPEEFVSRVLPLSETVLFGNQPFIADATCAALKAENTTAQTMRQNYQRRAETLVRAAQATPGLWADMPDAGMFVMVDIRGTGLDGESFALQLLEQQHVAVMPGEAFGAQGGGFARISLTITDNEMATVVTALCALAQGIAA